MRLRSTTVAPRLLKSAGMGTSAPSIEAERAADPGVLLWVLPVVYALHVMEEFAFGWSNWAMRNGLGFSSSDFLLTNAAVIVFGVCAAAIGYRNSALALSYPALMLVNGLFFHLVPTVALGRPNPGFLTAVLLFLPLGARCLADGKRSGVKARELAVAFSVAAFAQAFPLLLLALRSRMAWEP